MKVVFVNLPQPYLVEKKTQVPLGLLYLSAVLKKSLKDIEVEILDFSDKSVEESLASIEPADVFGISSVSLNYPYAVEIKDGIRVKYPSARIILGGIHPTVDPEGCLADGFDSVFVGEAENSLVDYIGRLRAGEVPSKIQRPIKWVDLTTLPWPDRDSFPWLGGNVLARGNDRSLNIMASRGCYYNCTFCSSETIWHRKVRWRPVDDVVNEIKLGVDKYGIKVFRFADDNLASNRKWVLDFCERVSELEVIWRLSARVDNLDRQLIKVMRAAGCVEMGIGVESFDDHVLQILNKHIEAKQSIDAINLLYEEGVGVRLLMMISTPGESYDGPNGNTVDRNIAALESVKDKYVYLTAKILMPFPGSAIWKCPEKYGVRIISRDFRKYNCCVYQLENGEQVRKLWSPIRFDNMSEEQQFENIRRMLDYCEPIPQTARGI